MYSTSPLQVLFSPFLPHCLGNSLNVVYALEPWFVSGTLLRLLFPVLPSKEALLLVVPRSRFWQLGTQVLYCSTSSSGSSKPRGEFMTQ